MFPHPRITPAIASWVLPLALAAQSPDAHWNFDGSTTAERLAERYGRATLAANEVNGSSAWSTRTGFGDVLANGSNSPYLAVARQSATDPAAGDFSFSIWAYRSSDDGAAAGIIDALNGTGTGFQWFYQANGNLRIRLDDHFGNTVNVDTAASQLALNTWRNFIVTVDRVTDRARIYADGVEATAAGGVSISSLSGNLSPDQDLWIGTLNGTTPAKGRLDDPALFKRLLTPQEIAAIQANGGSPVLSLIRPNFRCLPSPSPRLPGSCGREKRSRCRAIPPRRSATRSTAATPFLPPRFTPPLSPSPRPAKSAPALSPVPRPVRSRPVTSPSSPPRPRTSC